VAPDRADLKDSIVNTDSLYPPFAAQVPKLLANCAARGATYKVTSTVRSFVEQDKLYAQGRPGKDGKIVPGGIVTHAKAGQSYHNYGVACDFCRIVGGVAVWDRPSYSILGEEAAKLGLEWGGAWQFVDVPHVQLRVKLADLQAQLKKGGIEQVWKWLDSCNLGLKVT
jgi:peptidoglycan L-alanyl-D-glutamate endopeptidase CwlK